MNLEDLKDARARIVAAIAVAQERGGCTGRTMDEGTGRVCAVGAMVAAHMKLPVTDKRWPSYESAHVALRETAYIHDRLACELLDGKYLPRWNDIEFAKSENPATATLSLFLEKIDEKIAMLCPRVVENHEREVHALAEG